MEAVKLHEDLIEINPTLVVLLYARVRFAPSYDYMIKVNCLSNDYFMKANCYLAIKTIDVECNIL